MATRLHPKTGAAPRSGTPTQKLSPMHQLLASWSDEEEQRDAAGGGSGGGAAAAANMLVGNQLKAEVEVEVEVEVEDEDEETYAHGDEESGDGADGGRQHQPQESGQVGAAEVRHVAPAVRLAGPARQRPASAGELAALADIEANHEAITTFERAERARERGQLQQALMGFR